MGIQITAAQVRAVSLNFGKADICMAVADAINKNGDEMKLDTVLRIKHFLGQVCIESDFYRSVEEGLDYRPETLVRTWPNRFKSIDFAKDYAHNPQKLANYVYGGRYGNSGPDDGWRFRGSSVKQITFHDNFAGFTKWMKGRDPNTPDFTQQPELLRTMEWATWPALWYWAERGCYQFADKDDTKGLTKNINGGYNALEDRIKATAVAGKVLNAPTQATPQIIKPAAPDPLLKEYQVKMVAIAKASNFSKFYPGTPDGWNGKNTESAIRAIQTATNIQVDGKLGPNTRGAIDALCKRYGV